MVRTIQQYGVVLLIFLLICVTLKAQDSTQCDTTEIRLISEDSTCKKVIMSSEMFTVFYKYKTNLEFLQKEIPTLEDTLAFLKLRNRKIEETLETTIDTLHHQKLVIKSSLSDCSETLYEVDRENLKLTKENERLKQRQWKMLGAGLTIPPLLYGIVKLITII